MNRRYIGKFCPYCKAAFKENDDIVICSKCNTPHHNNCWVENGKCAAVGCLGTIASNDPDKGADFITSEQMASGPLFGERIKQPQPQQNGPSITYCSRCGTPNDRGASFCLQCGNSLRASATPSGRSNQGNSQQSQSDGCGFNPRNESGDDVRCQLVGKNYFYYSTKFSQIAEKSNKSSWNWCSFLFSGYWFIYRRMYGWGIGILAARLIMSLIPSTLIALFALAFDLALGIFGNYTYMNRIDDLAAETVTMSDIAKQQFYAEKGGVDTKATIISIVAYVFIGSIIRSLFI